MIFMIDGIDVRHVIRL